MNTGGMQRINAVLAGIRFSFELDSRAAVAQLEEFRGDFPKEHAQAVIKLTDELIRRERLLAAESERCSREMLALLSLHRAVAERLPDFNALALHASALELNGEGVLMLGKSGAGKSTHALLWRERFGGAVRMINDDKPLLRMENGAFYVYGSPWKGKHALGSSGNAPIRAAIFVQKAEKNAIRALTDAEYWQLMASQAFMPIAADAALNTLSLLDRLKNSGVKLLMLDCLPEISAAETAYRAAFGDAFPV